jgi:hypothetical protein
MKAGTGHEDVAKISLICPIKQQKTGAKGCRFTDNTKAVKLRIESYRLP